MSCLEDHTRLARCPRHHEVQARTKKQEENTSQDRYTLSIRYLRWLPTQGTEEKVCHTQKLAAKESLGNSSAWKASTPELRASGSGSVKGFYSHRNSLVVWRRENRRMRRPYRVCKGNRGSLELSGGHRTGGTGERPHQQSATASTRGNHQISPVASLEIHVPL